ncbi:MAG: hypothetical protein ACXVXE_16555 [Nocardioidaceae bacterium]
MRALGAVGAALALGTGAVAVAAVGGASSTRPGEPAALGQRPGLTASGGGGRSTPAGATPAPAGATPAPAGRGPSRSASASSTGATGPTREPRVAVRAKVAVPSTDSATRTLRSALGRPSGSADTGHPSGPSQGSSSSPSRSGSPSSSPSARDHTSPITFLTKRLPEGKVAEFTFGANEPASFACSLDGAAYAPCTSPAQYADLDPGWHTFSVRATDTGGNVDGSPATVRWHANGRPSMLP